MPAASPRLVGIGDGGVGEVGDTRNSDRAGNLVRQELEEAAAGWDRDHRDQSRLAFSPDGGTLASARKDRLLRFWNVADIAEPTPVGPAVSGHSDAVNTVAFSADGRTLVTGSSDRTAKHWPLDVDRVIERICATSRNVLTAEQWEKHVGQPGFVAPCP